jgi:pyruvate dehydrogenase E2 component (dihydrolipoamide acetyltransferase)
MIEFEMPSLGADMDAGTLVEWYKKPGDAVKRGDIIALVETQKGAIEIEIFNDGTVADLKVGPGQKVPVGTVLATIVEPGEAKPKPLPAPPRAEPAAKPAEPAPAPPPVAAPPRAVVPPPPAAAPARAAKAGRPKVTPAALKRAVETGVDLATVAPAADGVIGLREVEAAGAARPAPRKPGLDLGEMRKAIAAAMSRSHREIPHYWVSQTIDVTPLFDWLEAENAKRPVAARLLYAAPLMKAVALALKETPQLNGHYVGDVFTPAESVHLGVATSLRGGGLVAPALHDVEKLGIDALMAALADLVPRARAGRLRSSELTDATATFSNLGEGTSDSLMPLIYPPQVAIIGCGAAAMRPWVVDNAVVARRLLNATVAGDHRVSDGRRASQFLSRLDQLLQKPEDL